MKMYGEFLDDSQRCETDVNEIVIYDDYAEIVLYDLLFEPLEYGVIIDKEDVEKVKLHCWSKKNGCIVANQFGRHVLLPNIILETDEKIEYINGDYLDCRKENLKIVEKKNKKSRNNYSVSKRNKNKVIVEIIGANRHQVTGSATLISIPLKEGGYKRILIELGGNQTNQDLYTEYLRNKEIVESVPHNEIDYVFALHAHYDHIGNLPSLIPNGFNGKLITNKENREIMTPMLVDGAFIMNKNVQALNKKHNITHLYKEEDVYLLMSRCETYSMNEIHTLDDLVSFQFVNAGHILGSCQLILYLKTPTGQIKKLHFTSDLGSDYNKQPFVKPKDIVNSSNFSLFEATYNELDRGFKSKKECEREREEFKKFLKNELKNKRNILIGVFAQARQQTMMEFLYRSFKDDKDFNYPIYVDGVLGLTLNNCYLSVLEGEDREYWKEVMSWENFKYISSYEKSMNVACNKSEICIKISSSGMFSNGRIMNHVKTMIEDSNCTFVLCGYQGEGTVGRELQRTDNTEVKIEGMMFKKKCKIYQMNTWSSHIMPMENINYMSQINTPLIVINHSDEEHKYEFRDIVESELRLRNNSAKVVCASDDNNIFYI
jgi:metallo-beta-lactamase family protein